MRGCRITSRATHGRVYSRNRNCARGFCGGRVRDVETVKGARRNPALATAEIGAAAAGEGGGREIISRAGSREGACSIYASRRPLVGSENAVEMCDAVVEHGEDPSLLLAGDSDTALVGAIGKGEEDRTAPFRRDNGAPAARRRAEPSTIRCSKTCFDADYSGTARLPAVVPGRRATGKIRVTS